MSCCTGGDPRTTLERRVDGIGWGLFLVALGMIWLAPEDFPEGAVMIAVGGTLAGITVLRWILGAPASGFLGIVGLVLMTIGLRDAGMSVPLVPLVLLAVGAGVVLSSLTAKA
jgi:hypothetical protein